MNYTADSSCTINVGVFPSGFELVLPYSFTLRMGSSQETFGVFASFTHKINFEISSLVKGFPEIVDFMTF